ncbi:MAG: hypothetical protein ABSB71_12770 [Candidatus Bathyarchaeia archaeon]
MTSSPSATCPICGFRYPVKKFSFQLRPIDSPLQTITSGGNAWASKFSNTYLGQLYH